jgi:hypothetical protein
MEAWHQPEEKGIDVCRNEKLVFLCFVHLSFDLLSSESVHQFDCFTNFAWLFFRRGGFTDVNLYYMDVNKN